MTFDHERLVSFIGNDLGLEREFLGLLQETLNKCLASLETPSAATYSALHAAKPGILVAAHTNMENALNLACQLCIPNSQQQIDLNDSTLKALAEFRELSEKMLQEISAHLTPTA